MMPDDFTSITFDSSSVMESLNGLSDKLADLTAPMTAIGEYLLLSTDEHFEKEVDPAGVPWKPDSPYTIDFKKKNNRILKILQSTGRLRNSIAYAADATSVTLGTNVPYAPDHQLGLDGKTKREFLGVSEADELVILEIIQDYLTPDP
jgi:phage virion morphogenesis protein